MFAGLRYNMLWDLYGYIIETDLHYTGDSDLGFSNFTFLSMRTQENVCFLIINHILFPDSTEYKAHIIKNFSFKYLSSIPFHYYHHHDTS